MITQAQYKARSRASWIGQKVRARHQLQNGHFTVPAGTVLVVTDKQAGFGLMLAEPCKCCGLRGHINKVNPQLLDLVE